MYDHSELEIRQQKGLLSKDAVLLAVEDPKANIGSGSACLNALLCVAEFLAAREGMTVRNPHPSRGTSPRQGNTAGDRP